jgi:hypothetical protein
MMSDPVLAWQLEDSEDPDGAVCATVQPDVGPKMTLVAAPWQTNASRWYAEVWLGRNQIRVLSAGFYPPAFSSRDTAKLAAVQLVHQWLAAMHAKMSHHQQPQRMDRDAAPGPVGRPRKEA